MAKRRNPIIAQRELRELAKKNAPKPTGQVPPPPPPAGGDAGSAPTPPKEEVDGRREALETLPDKDLVEKAEALLHDYDESWDRPKLIEALLAAGVAG